MKQISINYTDPKGKKVKNLPFIIDVDALETDKDIIISALKLDLQRTLNTQAADGEILTITEVTVDGIVNDGLIQVSNEVRI